jgi:hypothetical protein
MLTLYKEDLVWLQDLVDIEKERYSSIALNNCMIGLL